MSITTETPIGALKGVGNVRAQQLTRVGIETVGDLIFYFPRAYEKRGRVVSLPEAIGGEKVSVILTVASEVRSAQLKNRMTIQKFRAFDDFGSCEIVFFNAPYVRDVFHVGSVFRFYGNVAYSKTRTVQMIAPQFDPVIAGAALPDFVPIYPLTEGLSSKYIAKLLSEATAAGAVIALNDPLPESIRLAHSLPTLAYAVRNAHFPESEEALSRAMRRLAFDELFTFALGIALSSRAKNHAEGIRIPPASLLPFTEKLPYELTGAQKRAFNDIYRDMVIGDDEKTIRPMTRILVGDVGSGKTVVAQMAMYLTAVAGKQAALMAPTEILAEQHFADTAELFSALGIETALLTGSTPQKEKKRVYTALAEGRIRAVIGTHALLSDKVAFSDLALVITDEQHRFGVAQRAILKEKSSIGRQAHLLVMSATPIPRTLALTLYGDLDVSRIDEMPKGRMRVDTYVVDESYRKRLDDFIRKQIALGGQCYIVCPSIDSEEDEKGDICAPSSISVPFSGDAPALKNVMRYTEELSRKMPDLSIGLLHGRMPAAEKVLKLRKVPQDEEKFKVGAKHVFKTIGWYLFISLTFYKFGMFLGSPVYIHWRTLYMTFPFYIWLLVPLFLGGLKVKNILGLVPSKKLNLGLAIGGLVMHIGLSVYIILMGKANSMFVSNISQCMPLERLAAMPVEMPIHVLAIGAVAIILLVQAIKGLKNKEE